MRILGIDNGLDGGLVLLDGTSIRKKAIMPTVGKGKRSYDLMGVRDLIADMVPDFTVVEWAQAFPGQGVTSTFSTGLGFGAICGILTGMQLKFTLIRPQAWQKEIFAGMSKADTKAASYLFCSRTWPTERWQPTERAKNPHDGMTDGACLAEYGRRHAFEGVLDEETI